MKNRLLTLLALFFAFSSASIFSQETQDSELPKFKQDALKLWLSPSNQIHNKGVGDYGTEKERMNEVADVMEPILKAQGIKVYRNDPKESIRDYTRRANELGCDLYFAIHSNAFNGKASGQVSFCHKFGGEGERFAKRVNKAVMSIYPGLDRGVLEGYRFYGGKPMWETSDSNMPACLVEVAFHDNPEDAKWIVANIEPIGKVLARAVLEHFAAEHPDALEK